MGLFVKLVVLVVYAFGGELQNKTELHNIASRCFYSKHYTEKFSAQSFFFLCLS